MFHRRIRTLTDLAIRQTSVYGMNAAAVTNAPMHMHRTDTTTGQTHAIVTAGADVRIDMQKGTVPFGRDVPWRTTAILWQSEPGASATEPILGRPARFIRVSNPLV